MEQIMVLGSVFNPLDSYSQEISRRAPPYVFLKLESVYLLMQTHFFAEEA